MVDGHSVAILPNEVNEKRRKNIKTRTQNIDNRYSHQESAQHSNGDNQLFSTHSQFKLFGIRCSFFAIQNIFTYMSTNELSNFLLLFRDGVLKYTLITMRQWNDINLYTLR